MDANHINPFIEALVKVFAEMGISDVKVGKVTKKNFMHVDKDVTALIGIVGDIKGNIAYSLTTDTALKVISTMMMGADVKEIDYMGRSAVGELSNMITGKAAGILGGKQMNVVTTPPSLVFGKDVFFVISQVDALAIEMSSSIGNIEINVGLEI